MQRSCPFSVKSSLISIRSPNQSKKPLPSSLLIFNAAYAIQVQLCKHAEYHKGNTRVIEALPEKIFWVVIVWVLDDKVSRIGKSCNWVACGSRGVSGPYGVVGGIEKDEDSGSMSFKTPEELGSGFSLLATHTTVLVEFF